MLLLDEDVYRKNREFLQTWLCEADATDSERLWLAANNAMENAARNLAAKAPASLGVAQILSEARHNAFKSREGRRRD
jgi:hypothetical protein